jgi:23S rRNA pseudouridine2605 synthase
MPIRLQKILSAAGVASRRAAEKLIVAGRVAVNGETVRELGTRANPDADDIRVDGRRIGRPPRRYLALHKPRGYVTTRSDPEHRPTVLDLVGVQEYIYPIGRLDYDSEGLLLLTNDGEFAERLMHPRYGVEREYEARVRGVPEPAVLGRLAHGVRIEGRRTAPADVRVVETGRGARGDQAVISVVVHEGRTRQVRKMCEEIGHPVVRLRRVRIGPIPLGSLKPGEFRELTRDEVRQLERAATVPAPATVRTPKAGEGPRRPGTAGRGPHATRGPRTSAPGSPRTNAAGGPRTNAAGSFRSNVTGSPGAKGSGGSTVKR